MEKKNRKPAWWQLGFVVPFMLVLLFGLHLIHLSADGEEIGDIVVLILTFGGVLAWVHANGGALERYYTERDNTALDFQVTVYEPASDRRALSRRPTGPEVLGRSVQINVTRDAGPGIQEREAFLRGSAKHGPRPSGSFANSDALSATSSHASSAMRSVRLGSSLRRSGPLPRRAV